MKLQHIALPAKDAESLCAWYAEHLDMTKTGLFAENAFSTMAFRKGTPIRNSVFHFGFTVSDIGQVAKKAEYFRQKGIKFAMVRDGNALMVSDPEGNRVEIMADANLPSV